MTALRALLPRRPATQVPPGAWDCHVHLFGPPHAYPLAAARRYTPGLATPADLSAALDRMGVDHAVLVQASPYGNDHSCLLDGLAATKGSCRGVASFRPGERPDARLLRRLRGAGVRGLRVHLLRSGLDAARHVLRDGAALAGEMGWHVELHATPDQIDLVEQEARRFAGVFVLDHMMYASEPEVPRLAAIPNVRVKIAGLYRQPNPAAAVATARALLALMPRRCLWGSDWPHTPPHPAMGVGSAPLPFRAADAGADFDTLFTEADAAALEAMLCKAPQSLFGSPASRHSKIVS